MHKKRLLKLADFLETVPRTHFNMGSWDEQRECGFAGCALGWAAHGKLFRGFTLRNSSPEYKGHSQYHAAAALFEIIEDQADDLFNSLGPDKTPKQVAKRIRKFVETGSV